MESQRWDYISLSDFKSTSCWTGFTYVWLWILAIISIAVYGADTYTAISLLAFNRWTSQVQPTIPFDVSKWIFASCIILSFIILAFEWIRAIRVIRRGGVADSYLDPLAVVWQSMRPGSGRGWRRFLVFAELTKSRKGVDYVALFVYFQFKGEEHDKPVLRTTLIGASRGDHDPPRRRPTSSRQRVDTLCYHASGSSSGG